MLGQLQPILTKAAKHKKGRKAKVRPIFVSKQLELKYAKALHGFIDEMHKETLNQLLMQNMGDNKTVADSLLDRFLAILNHLKALFLSKVSDIAAPLASMIVKAQQKASDKQLGELLKKQIGLDFDGLMRDEDLAEVINEAIHANVSLIKSIPQEYFDKIEKAVLSSIQSGTLNRDLAKQLESIESTTKSRANLIATDQLGKINSRISQIRQQKLGITHYTWSTSCDERVRHSHRLRDGQIFAWDNPPDDGHAGMAIRCRCVAIPYTEHLMGGQSPIDAMAEQEVEQQNDKKFFDDFMALSINSKTRKFFDDSPKIVKKSHEMGLNNAQIVSLMGYTYMHGFIQKHLYNPKPIKQGGLMDVIDKQIQYMITGLDKLPNYQGQVVRRVRPYSDIVNLNKGDIFISQAFMSSAILGDNDIFAHLKVRMLMTVKTGKRIDWLSLKPEQREVLILPNTPFKVLNVEQKGDELWLTMSEE